MIFTQNDFSGGMDFLNKETNIAANAYKLLINARNRYGKLEPVYKSTDVTGMLSGLHIQGLYSIGEVLICFASGKAYYSLFSGDFSQPWIQVPNLSMDQDVDIIYTQLVTGSVNDYLRIPAVNDDGSANPSGPISTSNKFNIAGTPAGLVCQDGINQPWLIAYDPTVNQVTARVTHTYDQWSNTSTVQDDREYVPIGSIMYFDGTILYVVAPDGFTIFRSVSGRPLDFMVNIDTNGNKLSTEALGGARTTSFAVNFQPITAITSAAAGQFLISTNTNIFGYEPDFTVPTIFGEPQFTRIFTLFGGLINNFSGTDINGNAALISFTGIKDFNAIEQSRIENQNSNFSLPVSRLFLTPDSKPIYQNGGAAIEFNNFNLFALNTTFGKCIVIYDNLVQVWSAIDINQVSVQGIKQFAIPSTSSEARLFCCTYRDKIYRMYANEDDSKEESQFQSKAWAKGSENEYYATTNTQNEHRSMGCFVRFKQGVEDGKAAVKEYVDDQSGQWLRKDLPLQNCGMNFPMQFPIGFDNKPTIRTVPFIISQGNMGSRISVCVLWDNDFQLEELQLNTNLKTTQIGNVEQQIILKS